MYSDLEDLKYPFLEFFAGIFSILVTTLIILTSHLSANLHRNKHTSIKNASCLA